MVSATASAQGGIGNDTSGRSTTRIRLSRFVWIISLSRSLRHTERTHEELSVGMNRYVYGMCVRHCRVHCSVHCPRCALQRACGAKSNVRAAHAVCSSFAMRSRQHIVSFMFVRTGPRKSATGSRGYGASGMTGSLHRRSRACTEPTITTFRCMHAVVSQTSAESVKVAETRTIRGGIRTFLRWGVSRRGESRENAEREHVVCVCGVRP